MIHSYPGCRQGRNNVRLIQDLRIAVQQSNHVLSEVVLRLVRASYLAHGDPQLQPIYKGIVEFCELQQKMNAPVEEEAHNTLD